MKHVRNLFLRGAARLSIVALCLDLLFAQGQARDLQKWNLAERWNSITLQGMRDAKMGAPMAARALGIVHTCMYDAWAAYDEHAVGTQLRGALRRPASERTESNKERAISYAAYRALTDVLPVDTETAYKGLMRELGYDPKDNSTDIETPTGIGNVVCAAVLEFRHHDQSNQLGDMLRIESSGNGDGPLGIYGDWSGYRPVNQPGTVPIHFPMTKPLDPDHWLHIPMPSAA
jgi:hypothetical protein